MRNTESTMTANQATRPVEKRKGLMSRFRLGRGRSRNVVDTNEIREPTPSPPLEESLSSKKTGSKRQQRQQQQQQHQQNSLNAAPQRQDVSDRYDDESLRRENNSRQQQSYLHDEFGSVPPSVSGKLRMKSPGGHPFLLLQKPPPAKEAAFSGPPRYDWIDIETAAAIKVQSVARRNKVMADLERSGRTTAAIRNRSRRRRTKVVATGTDDVPSLFNCCGVGLAFGDATDEDYQVKREYQKQLYEERKKEREEKEAMLRQNFLKKVREKTNNGQNVQEIYEIVE